MELLTLLQMRGGHQHVIRFWGHHFGADVPVDELMLVTELAKHGSLLVRAFYLPSRPLFVQWGKSSTLCTWSPLCRGHA